jgi:uncharacterized protein (DUF1330 family)
MSLVLCVLLWPHPGTDDALVAYEDRVLEVLADHGGRVLQRARSNGTEGQPLEFQILEFPSSDAFKGYMTDDRRMSLAYEREKAVARTDVVKVKLIGPRG